PRDDGQLPRLPAAGRLSQRLLAKRRLGAAHDRLQPDAAAGARPRRPVGEAVARAPGAIPAVVPRMVRRDQRGGALGRARDPGRAYPGRDVCGLRLERLLRAGHPRLLRADCGAEEAAHGAVEALVPEPVADRAAKPAGIDGALVRPLAA